MQPKPDMEIWGEMAVEALRAAEPGPFHKVSVFRCSCGNEYAVANPRGGAEFCETSRAEGRRCDTVWLLAEFM